MSNAELTLILRAKNLAGAEVNKLHDSLDKVGVKASSATGILGKLGNVTGGLVTPQTLAATAAIGIATALFGAAQAAEAEQVNIAKLGASLKANIPNWDGNTTAIEALISQREKLAFSDDDLRDSLALLVGATHDVGKAEAVQATAMDLARLKGISLQDASTALIKVENGQFRALKALGIQLKDGATAQDALTAVQKVAAGQAEAYANTTQGAAESLGIALADLNEEIGQALLPTIKEFVVFLRDDAVPVIRDFFGIVTAGINNLPISKAEEGFKRFREAATTEAEKAAEAQQKAAQQGMGALGLMVKAYEAKGPTTFTPLTDAADKAQKDVKVDLNKMHKSLRDGQNQIGTDAKNLADALVHPISAALRKKELLDILNGKSSVGKQLIKGLNSSDPLAQEAARELKQDVLDQLEQLDRTFTAKVNVIVRGRPQARAIGGPVVSDQAYTVGEHGPETLVMGSQSGYVMPGRRASSSDSGHGHDIYMDGRLVGQLVDKRQGLSLALSARTSNPV